MGDPLSRKKNVESQLLKPPPEDPDTAPVWLDYQASFRGFWAKDLALCCQTAAEVSPEFLPGVSG
jgi:hypothetical protein